MQHGRHLTPLNLIWLPQTPRSEQNDRKTATDQVQNTQLDFYIGYVLHRGCNEHKTSVLLCVVTSCS
jgi:hypothetical protein